MLYVHAWLYSYVCALIVNHSVVKVFLCFHADDKDADQLSSGSDSGGSRSRGMQNSELAGGLEIFVDDLPQDCVKEDIAMAFSQSGEVKSVRIIKNSSTGKNQDIAFVCYTSIEAAKKVLAEFKEGIEVLNLTTPL
jgi:hypothetical protein